MIRRPPRSTRTDTLFPTRRSSDLLAPGIARWNGLFLSAQRQFRPSRLDHHHPCRFRRTRVRATDLAGEGKRRWFRSGARRYSRAAQDARRCRGANRSEEHTSELQSLMRISYAVFCLKKKNITNSTTPRDHIYNMIHNKIS